MRSNCNQTMKLGQSIEYTMRNLSLEKSHKRNYSQTLSKKTKLSIPLDQ